LDYSNKVRVRACGILVQNDAILLAELLSPITKKTIWTPPGGGVEFGEKLQETVKREFLEETGLHVEVKELLHFGEIIQNRHHAIEFYFRVQKLSGEVKLGIDPELSSEEGILKSLEFKTKEELFSLNVSPSFLKDDLWKRLIPLK
jgi:8-oxo-dGTP diphosphatase